MKMGAAAAPRQPKGRRLGRPCISPLKNRVTSNLQPGNCSEPPSGTVTEMLLLHGRYWAVVPALAGAIACGGSRRPASDLKVDGSSTVLS